MKTKFNNNKVILTELSSDGWFIGGEEQIKLKKKIEKIGTPLKDWDVNIKMGIITGYNEAFIIDTETKERLCKEDSKNEDIIKPILRGRDIKRYSYKWSGLWLIHSHNGLKSKGINTINIKKDYPVIYKYLQQFRTKLIKRQNKGYHWTNLRNCAYLEEFEKEKIAWKQTSSLQTFIYDDNNYYLDVTSQMLIGKNLKYMLTCLNSKLINFVFRKISCSFGKKGTRWIPEFISKISIPIISEKDQQPFIAKADIMLGLNKRLLDKKNMFYNWLGDIFNVKKLSKNLQNIENINKNIFITELKKIKIDVKVFNQCIDTFTELKDIKIEIDRVDATIDNMVFDLYGLTDNERMIIMEK